MDEQCYETCYRLQGCRDVRNIVEVHITGLVRTGGMSSKSKRSWISWRRNIMPDETSAVENTSCAVAVNQNSDVVARVASEVLRSAGRFELTSPHADLSSPSVTLLS